ncbi:hypothetical protein CaCOL14_013385 [Colletotrichum acutatum]
MLVPSASAQAGSGRLGIQHEAPPFQAPAGKPLHVNPKRSNAKTDLGRGLWLFQSAVNDGALNSRIAETSGHDPREILAAISKLEDDELFIAKEGLASPPEPTTLSGSNVTTALLPAGALLGPAKTPGMMPGPVCYSNQVNKGGGNQYNGDFSIYCGPPETFNGNRSLDTVSSPKRDLEIPALPKSGPDVEDVPSRDCESEDAGDTCVVNGGTSIALDNDTPACRKEAVDHQTPQYKGREEHPDVGTQQPAKPSTSGEGCPCDKLQPGLLHKQNVRLVAAHCHGDYAERELEYFKSHGKPTAAIYLDDPSKRLTTIEGIVADVERGSILWCWECRKDTKYDFRLGGGEHHGAFLQRVS